MERRSGPKMHEMLNGCGNYLGFHMHDQSPSIPFPSSSSAFFFDFLNFSFPSEIYATTLCPAKLLPSITPTQALAASAVENLTLATPSFSKSKSTTLVTSPSLPHSS